MKESEIRFFYKNGIVTVSESGVYLKETPTYEDSDTHVINRDFKRIPIFRWVGGKRFQFTPEGRKSEWSNFVYNTGRIPEIGYTLQGSKIFVDKIRLTGALLTGCQRYPETVYAKDQWTVKNGMTGKSLLGKGIGMILNQYRQDGYRKARFQYDDGLETIRSDKRVENIVLETYEPLKKFSSKWIGNESYKAKFETKTYPNVPVSYEKKPSLYVTLGKRYEIRNDKNYESVEERIMYFSRLV